MAKSTESAVSLMDSPLAPFFQRRIEKVSAGTGALAYLDDILIGGKDVQSLASSSKDHLLKIE